MYFNENHAQYLKDSAVTISHGGQFLVGAPNITETEKTNVNVLHAAVGLATELGELYPLEKHSRDLVNVQEEIGDMYWYLAIVDRLLLANNYTLEIPKYERDILFEEAKDDLPTLILAGLLDQAKKLFIYGKPSDLTLMFNTVMKIHGCLQAIIKFYGFDVDAIREMNTAKLKKRFGEKFSAAAALNRDLNAERQVLEETATTPTVQG